MGKEATGDDGQGHQVIPGVGQGGGRTSLSPGGCGPPFQLSFWLPVSSNKIGILQFILSDSENISCTTFLKPKTAENMNWHCGTLLIG